MQPSVRIDSLPVDLTLDEAVDAVYGDDLRWIEEKLRASLSVLVECDKQLVPFLYRALRRGLRREVEGNRLRCRLVAGRPRAASTIGTGGATSTSGGAAQSTSGGAPAGGPPAPSAGQAEDESAHGIIGRILEDLGSAVRAAESDSVIVMPHLDLLTTTTRSGLSLEARSAIAWFYENPDVVFLGFSDPTFELPKAVENVYSAKRTVTGIPRDTLRRVITRREARKLGHEELDPFRLYKYVSGLNVVKFRRILEHFHERLDFDPDRPEGADEIYRDIREMTLVGDLEVPRVPWDEIGGYDKVKTRIREEILDLLAAHSSAASVEDKKRIEELIPKGMVFVGPPGTGKTYFAKAIATAIDGTAIVVSGPELKSKWVGESEANLRAAFTRARKSAPSVIIFDEIDSFASVRGLYAGSGVEHSMVNQLLTEMDGFRKEELVFIIGTTNFPDALDPALLRPGRFELVVDIPYPSEDDRRAILKLYLERFALAELTDDEMLEHIVRKTGGYVDVERGTRFSGDHLYAICRALKREEARHLAKAATDDSLGPFVVDKDRIARAIGLKAAGRVEFTAEEERVIATHEAGHALCAALLPRATAVEKISIATGEEDVLGFVLREVRKNRYVVTRGELEADLAVLMGGRVAEELVFGDPSVGAYDDIQKASELARAMVEELGLGRRVGARAFGRPRAGGRDGAVGPSRQHDRTGGLSETMRDQIDREIGIMLKRAYDDARGTLEQAEPALRELADALIEKKQMDRSGLDEILERHGLARTPAGGGKAEGADASSEAPEAESEVSAS